MQLDRWWKMWLQFLPYTHHKVFNRTKFSFHKIHINIQVTMIKLFNHFLIDQSTQFLCIKNKTGFRIWVSFYCNKQFKIVAMPVFVGAFAKDLMIFFLTPVGIIELMCSVKMFNSC